MGVVNPKPRGATILTAPPAVTALVGYVAHLDIDNPVPRVGVQEYTHRIALTKSYILITHGVLKNPPWWELRTVMRKRWESSENVLSG